MFLTFSQQDRIIDKYKASKAYLVKMMLKCSVSSSVTFPASLPSLSLLFSFSPSLFPLTFSKMHSGRSLYARHSIQQHMISSEWEGVQCAN